MAKLGNTLIRGMLKVMNGIKADSIEGDLIGNADTTTRLKKAIQIKLIGDVTGTITSDLGADISIDTTVGDDSHNHDASNITKGTLVVARGGTGKTSVAANRMLYASAANVYSEVITSTFGRSLLNATSGTVFSGLNADSVDGKHVNDTQVTTSYLWTAAKVKSYVDSLLASNDAMIFKGTMGVGGTVTGVPTSGYGAGWSYKIITAGTYAGIKCEVGDLIICIKDYATAYSNSDWSVVQTNIDGAVTNSNTSVANNHIPIFDGTTGNVIKTSGKALPSGNVVGDTSFGTTTVGGVVKSSTGASQVSINANGIMTVNTIAVNKGGTGKTSVAANRMLYASAANVYSEVTTSAFGRSLLNATSGTMFTGLNADTVDGKHVNDAQTSTSYLWTAGKVKSYVDALLASNDAMIFKGTLGTGGTVTSLPTSYDAGWTYKIVTAGTYAGDKCEIGDLIICTTDSTTFNNTHWSVVQTNIDGAVTNSNTSVVANHIPIFDGTTGNVIKTSGKALPSGNVVGDTSFGTTTVGGVVKSSNAINNITINASGIMTVHSLNTSKITTGTLPITRGGTGATTAAGIIANLGITASAAELNYIKGLTSAVQTQLNAKVATEAGKGLSTNDYTTTEKNKLAAINQAVATTSTVRFAKVGIGVAPTEALDVNGNAKIRSSNSLKFGGTTASDSVFEIKYNPNTKSLDINCLI